MAVNAAQIEALDNETMNPRCAALINRYWARRCRDRTERWSGGATPVQPAPERSATELYWRRRDPDNHPITVLGPAPQSPYSASVTSVVIGGCVLAGAAMLQFKPAQQHVKLEITPAPRLGPRKDLPG